MERKNFSKQKIVVRDRAASPERRLNADRKRFWRSVKRHESGCLIWVACQGRLGYGSIWSSFFKKRFSATRFAWFIHHGELPTLHVLHRCDVPGCVDKDHLFQGTHADNMRDMAAKGRGIQKHPGRLRGIHAKLSPEQVLQIYRRKKVGERTVSLMREYGVGRTTINSIGAGIRYGYVTSGADGAAK